jgi:hypothetical protein
MQAVFICFFLSGYPIAQELEAGYNTGADYAQNAGDHSHGHEGVGLKANVIVAAAVPAVRPAAFSSGDCSSLNDA